jgi:peptidyl-prolyl cis-trans isomerase B (cyclophilin B)
VLETALKQIDYMIATAAIDKADKKWRTQLPEPHLVSFSDEYKYYARIHTSKGPIVVQLRPEVAPMHVTSFIYLSRLGFYDQLEFHRVIPHFMAQGGCPLGTGTGGPGYTFDGEFSPEIKHDRPGLLSTANAGPGTDGSQFFITFVPTPHLDGKHTIFGSVTEGMDTLNALEAAGSDSGQTSEPLLIEKITIEVR